MPSRSRPASLHYALPLPLRLDHPFTRLPIRFDHEALAVEVARVSDEAWQAHPSAFPGNDALLLVSKDGSTSTFQSYR